MMPTLLFVIFTIHLAVFAFLAWRRREAMYWVLVATFILLLGAHALRTFAPGLHLGSVPAFWPLRVASWIGAAAGLVLLVRRRLNRGKGGERA
jgi:hypothetical protein